MIVDDHPVTRRGYVDLFSALPDYEIVAEAGAIEQAEALCADLKPDLVILDLALGHEHGLSLLLVLARAPEAPRILVVSMLDELVYGRAALELGARGYVAKNSGPSAITAAVEILSRGGLVIPARLLKDLTGVRGAKLRGSPGRLRTALSPAARALMLALDAEESLEALARRRRVSAQTLYTQLYRIRRQLGLDTPAQLRAYAAIYRRYIAPGGTQPTSGI